MFNKTFIQELTLFIFPHPHNTGPVCDAHHEFRCNDGQCVPSSYRCDGQYQCGDESDELYCPPIEERCHSDEWKCHSGECIPKVGYCNNYPDCRDHSDESDCFGEFFLSYFNFFIYVFNVHTFFVIKKHNFVHIIIIKII